MRFPLTLLSCIAVIASTATCAHAQTWVAPQHLSYVASQTIGNTTCNGQDHYAYFDGYWGGALDTVFVFNRRFGLRQPVLGAATLTLYPQGYVRGFEIWACQELIGNEAMNCPYEADNLQNIGQPVTLVLPVQATNLHVIVTTDGPNDSYQYCGAYLLTVQRQQ